ncbi:DNA excision repair protein ERCC-1 [Portunus trituberculatus]|uniref:DNA excision repair protein ERCC-1 n=1 Tax=Portunus trituberculatus TaxID=210409 RepID=A0A5B7CFJ9_PORTR|nr:DNA excision repair protein ERCC-1 [Portunus trituberculatus]
MAFSDVKGTLVLRINPERMSSHLSSSSLPRGGNTSLLILFLSTRTKELRLIFLTILDHLDTIMLLPITDHSVTRHTSDKRADSNHVTRHTGDKSADSNQCGSIAGATATLVERNRRGPKLVDVKEPHHELKQLTKICFLAEMTLMLAWSQEEAGRMIEVYKIYENKPPDMIMEKQDSNPYSMLIDALTSVRSINRTDAMTLLSTFGSLEKIVQATEEELAFCPGMGPQKASKLYKVLHQNFKK